MNAILEQLAIRAGRVARYLDCLEFDGEYKEDDGPELRHNASGLAALPNPSPNTFLGQIAIRAKRLGL